jgi:Ca2+-binding EF-hand superfamily protein
MEEDDIKRAFDAFDKNSDGEITFKEYVDGCRRNGT